MLGVRRKVGLQSASMPTLDASQRLRSRHEQLFLEVMKIKLSRHGLLNPGHCDAMQNLSEGRCTGTIWYIAAIICLVVVA